MIALLLFLLLQKPAAPFSNPNEPDDPAYVQKFEGSLTVPQNGNVIVSFQEEFSIPPSCSFNGGTLPGERPRITVRSVILKAKPGKTMKWECHGVKGDKK